MSSAQGSLVPAASVTSEEDLLLSFYSAVDRLNTVGFNGVRKSHNVLRDNLLVLASRSPETLDELVEHILVASDAEQQNWRWMLSGIKTLPDDDEIAEDSAAQAITTYRMLMAVHPLAAPISSKYTRYGVPVSAYQLIKKAERFVKTRDDATIELFQASVVVLGIQSLQNNSDTTGEAVLSEIEYESLGFIASNIEAVKRVIDGLVARRSTKMEVLAQLINSPAGLAEGHL